MDWRSGFALTGAKADERQTLLGILAADPALAGDLPGQTLIGDKNYYGKDFERSSPRLASTCSAWPAKASTHAVAPDLERHGGHTPAGVAVRVLQGTRPTPSRCHTPTMPCGLLYGIFALVISSSEPFDLTA